MDAAVKKKTLRLLSNGVYILTARHEDEYGGATVSWVSQASFRPPLLMAALRRESTVFQCLRESGFAALHVLGPEHRELAQRFFKPTQAVDGRINEEPFEPGRTKSPILCSAPAYVECRLRGVMDGEGDHAVVLLEVVEAELRQSIQLMTIAESPWEYGG